MAGNLCALARARLATYVDAISQGKNEQARSVIRTAAIAGTGTFLKDASSKAVEALVSQVVHNVAVPLDIASSIVRAGVKSMTKGTPFAPAMERAIASTLDAGGRRALRAGFADGWAKTVESWQAMAEARRIGVPQTGAVQDAMSHGFQPAHFQNPTINMIMNLPTQIISATARPWYYMSQQAALYNRASLMAMHEGLTGGSAQARVDGLMRSPTPEMAIEATLAGRTAVFQNDTRLGTAASDVRRTLEKVGKGWGGDLAANSLMPVTKIPGAVLTRGLVDTSPLGIFRGIEANLPGSKAASGTTMKALVRGGGIGTGMMLLGWKYADRAAATGTHPASRSEGNVEEATGGGASGGAIKIGGEWLATRAIMGTLAIPFELGATLNRLSKEPHVKSAWATAAAGTAQLVTEDSFLENLGRVAEAVKTGRMSNIAASLVPVPQIVGQVANAADSKKRVKDGFVETVASRAVPGYSRTLPPAHDVFGREETKDLGGASGSVQAFLDPSKMRADESNPVTNELQRLGVGIASPGGNVKVPGQEEPVKRSARDRDQQKQELGAPLLERLAETVNDPDYKTADDKEKRRVLASIISAFHKIGSERAMGAARDSVYAAGAK